MLRKLYEKIGVDKDMTLLGEILILTDKCTREQVRKALREQKKTGVERRMGNLLISICNINQDDVNEALEIQAYLREETCPNESMKRFEEAMRKFATIKRGFQDSLDDISASLDKVNAMVE